MSDIVIGIGGIGVTSSREDTLKTYALGSCVALVLLDPVSKSIGMAHIALPESKINMEKAEQTPGYFADTGVPELMKEMKKIGADIRRGKTIVKLAGGAKMMDSQNTFNIGKRNVLEIKKRLWQYGLGPTAEDVGGVISRTVIVEGSTGRVLIKSPNADVRKL